MVQYNVSQIRYQQFVVVTALSPDAKMEQQSTDIHGTQQEVVDGS